MAMDTILAELERPVARYAELLEES